MLRTVSSIPMSTSSPSKKEATQTGPDDKTKTFLFNLSKVVPSENNKRKKTKEELSSDDESYGEQLDEEPRLTGDDDDDEAERQLENLVFGSGAFMVDNMDKIQSKMTTNEKKS